MSSIFVSQVTLRICFQTLLCFRNKHEKDYLFSGISEFLDSGRKSWTLDSGCWTLDARPWTMDSGHWKLDAGRWTLDSGRWTLDAGLWTLDSGRWTLHFGHWALDTVVDCFRTESEPTFWFCLIKLLKVI